MRHTRICILILLFQCLAGTGAEGSILDPRARRDPILDAVAADLDQNGIDVRRSWRSKVGPPDENRAHLTRLMRYPGSRSAALTDPWMKPFLDSTFRDSALLAVKST